MIARKNTEPREQAEQVMVTALVSVGSAKIMFKSQSIKQQASDSPERSGDSHKLCISDEAQKESVF